MKSIVLALGIRRAFSGRFKLLLNWSKGLNSLLIITESEVTEKELDSLGVLKNHYNLLKNIGDALEVIKKIEPDFILIDDRGILSINKSYLSIIKKLKIITYTYPIKGLWSLRGLPLKNVESTKERWKRLIGRLFNEIVLRNYVNKIRMYSDVIIAQSYTASGILRYGYGIEPDLVLYNPVDRSIFNPKVDVETKFKSNYVTLYLGSGEGDTEISILNQICKILKDNNYKVYAFGDKRKVKHINNCDFEYLESLSDQELATVYSKSKFTIVPQVDEPIGYVTLESISTGTPVLSIYPEEGIVNGYNGFYSSKKLFRNLIKKFLDDVIKNYDEYLKFYSYSLNYSELFDMNDLSQRLLLYLKYTYITSGYL